MLDKIEYFLFVATTEENAISLIEGESLLVIESDNGDGWTRYLIIDQDNFKILFDQGKKGKIWKPTTL